MELCPIRARSGRRRHINFISRGMRIGSEPIFLALSVSTRLNKRKRTYDTKYFYLNRGRSERSRRINFASRGMAGDPNDQIEPIFLVLSVSAP